MYETGSVLKVQPKGAMPSVGVVKYPTVYLDYDAKTPEEYKPDTMAYMLHDNKTRIRPTEIVKVFYKAPAVKRCPIDGPVTCTQVHLDEQGMILTAPVDGTVARAQLNVDDKGKILSDPVDLIPYVKDEQDPKQLVNKAQEIIAAALFSLLHCSTEVPGQEVYVWLTRSNIRA